jgi:hypothetical protein
VLSGDDEILYLRAIEVRARRIVECAGEEGWLSDEGDAGDKTPSQRAVNDLAGILLHYHFDGDGCLTSCRDAVWAARRSSGQAGPLATR